MELLERCQEFLETTRAELRQARRELAAVDEALGEFYCPVRDPETDEKQGSFYLDHGVHLMRAELERLRCNHSAFNWNKQDNGDWICQGCGGLVPCPRNYWHCEGIVCTVHTQTSQTS